MTRCAALGLEHGHIFGMAASVAAAGGEIAAWAEAGEPLAGRFAEAWPDASPSSVEAVLADPGIDVVLLAGVPADRADLAIRAMEAGKDVMTDKPGATSLDQLARLQETQARTGRIWSVCFSERFENRATCRALDLVAEGAIGALVHMLGLGPHTINAPARPAWFFQRERYGGILTDIASHQFDQFLAFCRAAGDDTPARVTGAGVFNRAHPQFPELQDVGEASVATERTSGFIRVDWFTPAGVGVWGDTRLMLTGTGGTIEVRKNIDIAGQPGADHLILVRDTTERIQCDADTLPYAGRFLADVANRTETAMPQAHCFAATRLVLEAQQLAESAP